MRHNPIEDLNLLHCDLVMAAGMINTVTEAAMSGECTLAEIGNWTYVNPLDEKS